MNRTFVFGCVVVGLSALGCGSHLAVPMPVASVAPPQTKPSQPPVPNVKPDGDPSAAPSVVPRDEEATTLQVPDESVGGVGPVAYSVPSTVVAASGEKPLLSASDFTFVGSYPFSADKAATFGMGLTCRRVNGQLRFLTFSGEGKAKARLIEFALPEKVGEKITALTGSWDDIWSPAAHPNVGGGDEYGLWWEDAHNRLWTTHCTDYPGDPKPPKSASGTMQTTCIAVRTLDANGAVSNLRGEYGFEAIGQRAIYGGVQAIPQWFCDKYGITQPYVAGWGGYTSRMAQGLVPSMGLMVLAIPDPTTEPAGTVLPASAYAVLADHRTGTTNAKDWYTSYTGKGFRPPYDRGQRNADVANYYDGGDPRQNPKTAPSDAPAAGAQWLSPAPDGAGRFVWGDSFYNTGCWIDGLNKGGFIVIGSFAKGEAYYKTSNLHNCGRDAELQIFDPNDFGAVLQAKKTTWNVQPAGSKLLTPDLAPLGLLFPSGGNNPSGAVAGATFDAETGNLYLWCPGVNGNYGCCLVVYKVKS